MAPCEEDNLVCVYIIIMNLLSLSIGACLVLPLLLICLSLCSEDLMNLHTRHAADELLFFYLWCLCLEIIVK